MDFLIDRDVTDGQHAFLPQALSVDIIAGRQTFPTPDGPDPGQANRLLVFTGTVAAELRGSDSGSRAGVLRVRLRNPLPKSVVFVGSATMAALSSFHTDDDKVLFGVDAARTVLGPDPDGALGDGGLPDDDLYVLVNLSIGSNDAHLDRFSYHADVLVHDLNPDLESILVRSVGASSFMPSTTMVAGSAWEYQITMTGGVLQPFDLIVVESSDPADVSLGVPLQMVEIPMNATSGSAGAPPTSPNRGVTATITASFTRLDGVVTTKTATVRTVAVN